MEALFYLCSIAERTRQRPDGSGRSLFNGCLFVGALFMAMLSSMLRLFENYVYDVGGKLAACCAFGPVNPRNPFSSKGIAFTYVVLPIALAMMVIFGRAARNNLERIAAEYRVSKIACFLFVFTVVMLMPLGAQGKGLQPLAVLAGQAALYTTFAFWLRFQRNQRSGHEEGGSCSDH